MRKFRAIKSAVISGVLLTSFLSAVSTSAEELTDAGAIVAQANLTSYYAGEDGRAEARMLIKDGQGREQKRQFTILRRDRAEGGEQDFLVIFSRPSDVRNTVFLVEKKLNQDDNRWLYLPGLDLVKRISAGDKRTSFVGSHFFYEDVSGRGTEEDLHRLIKTEGDHYLVESKPKTQDSVEFQSYSSWINKQTFLPEKIEYTDADGQVYRRIEVLKTAVIQGYTSVIQSKTYDLRSGGETTLQFRYQKNDLGMGPEVFTERSLRKPPRQWLRRSQ